MKNILFAILILVLATSCRKEDINVKNEISGKWNLTSIQAFRLPVLLIKGELIWEFNTTTKKIKVTKNTTEEYTILDSGVYDFTFTTTQIKVDGVTYDYFFEEGKLILSDHPEVDGPIITFERN